MSMYWIIQREVAGEWFTKASAETEVLANAIAGTYEERFGWNMRFYAWGEQSQARRSLPPVNSEIVRDQYGGLFSDMTREQLEETALRLLADTERLRIELDEATGEIR